MMSIFGPGGKQNKDRKLETKYEEAENWQHGMLRLPEEAGQLEEHLEDKRLRLRLLVLLMAAAFFAISYKLFALQVVRGEEYREMAEGNRVRTKVIHADRGVILDRFGEILAQNKGSFDLIVMPFDLPSKKEDRKKVYENLATLIGMEASLIESKVSESEKKNSVFEPVLIKENLPRQEALLVETKHESLQGVAVEKNSVREYVDGPIFAHVLGYTGKISAEEFQARKDKYSPIDYIGKTGVEGVYEEDLRGKFGKEQIEVDATGAVKRVLASVSPESGYKLMTAIDAGLQKNLYEALRRSMENVGAKSAAAVAMNPKTGEILSLISLPSFDNNLFAKGIRPEDYTKLLNDPERPMFNRVVSGTYPPGSTIKMVTATAGLVEGVISADTTLPAPPALKIVNPYDPNVVYAFKDWKKEGFGSISTRDAIAWSSDVFFYQVGGGYGEFKGLGLERLREWQEKFGIGKLLGIDLPGEAEGLLPSEAWKKRAINENWYLGDTYNLAIGQGYLLTAPLQIASITATVANGGNIMWPHIGKQIVDINGRVVREIQPKILKEKIAPPEVLQTVREGMAGAASYGTARLLQYLPVKAAGKTGTAEFPGAEPGHEHAWFTAFAPVDDPQIVVTVLVEKGGEGSTAAVPVVYDALNYYFSR